MIQAMPMRIQIAIARTITSGRRETMAQPSPPPPITIVTTISPMSPRRMLRVPASTALARSVGTDLLRLPLALPTFELEIRFLHRLPQRRCRSICRARVNRAPTLVSVMPSTSAISA